VVVNTRARLALALLAASLLLMTAPTRAATPTVRSAEGIRAFLSVPKWYVTYDVSLDAKSEPAEDGSQGVLHVHTSGATTLAERIQGPSLMLRDQSTAPMPGGNSRTPTRAEMMAGLQRAEAALAQIDDAATWKVEGPADALNSTVEHMQARMNEWLDSTAVEQRVSWQYDTEQVHESSHGVGQLWGGIGFAFDLDVTQKKYNIALPWRFGDSFKSHEGVKGERRSQQVVNGEFQWVTEPAVHDFSLFSSVDKWQPEPDLAGEGMVIQGVLPDAVAPLSGTASYRIEMRAPEGGALTGTLVIRYTISPFPPAQVELVVKKPGDYRDWRPQGLEDETTVGNTIMVTAALRKAGGGDPPFKAARIRFKLLGTSKEPGICMNWPHVPVSPAPFDLEIEGSRNSRLQIDDDEGQAASRAGPDLTEATVIVSSHDYGGHAGLEVTAELENGDVLIGIVEGTTDERSLKLPSRPADSFIADSWLDQNSVAGSEDRADDEDEPAGDGFNGDGLTLYEEYRGFMEGGDWIEGDPNTKDLFVLNTMRSHGSTYNGIAIYKAVTELNVHEMLLDAETNPGGVINFNVGSGPHAVDQHAITIVPRPGPRGISARVDAIGTPGTARKVNMPPGWPTFQGRYLNGSGEHLLSFATTLAHEMLHASNVYHHGEADMDAVWHQRLLPDGTRYVTESRGGADMGVVTLLNEDGSPFPLGDYFGPGPEDLDVVLGAQRGQHSGDIDCLMRYDSAWAYVSLRDAQVRYIATDETTGDGLCTSIVGTGFNDVTFRPQSRYGHASPPDPPNAVLAQRGMCKKQVRVNDLGTEPKR